MCVWHSTQRSLKGEREDEGASGRVDSTRLHPNPTVSCRLPARTISLFRCELLVNWHPKQSRTNIASGRGHSSCFDTAVVHSQGFQSGTTFKVTLCFFVLFALSVDHDLVPLIYTDEPLGCHDNRTPTTRSHLHVFCDFCRGRSAHVESDCLACERHHSWRP
jgi:hypothetical protein